MGINDLLGFDFMDPPPVQTMVGLYCSSRDISSAKLQFHRHYLFLAMIKQLNFNVCFIPLRYR